MNTELSVSDRLCKGKSSRATKSEQRGRLLVYSCAALIILTTISLTLFLVIQGLQMFVKNGVNPLTFLTSLDWQPTRSAADGGPMYGALPFIVGSFAVTILAACIAAPLGIGAAIYMTEIAPRWGQKVLQPVIELLVGIPSVVYGFLGLSLLVPFLREHVGGQGFGLLAGMIVLSLMILPTVTSIAVDALRAIPGSLRESSLALGATRWQTIRRVIVPAAAPMLMTAVVLGMARAFGEALAVQMVIGNARTIATSLMDPTATLTTIITLNMGHTVPGSAENNALWSLALILLLMSYVFILLVRYLSSRRKFS
ncbi:phosphate ABC transporter permease subunit PstC [Shouchella lonarensis]|uniref:Phosphate transport system permease protein n=1 Tax=Shouchella lonarensis TaxID=1464122 RepID=A0A1G6K0T5_9BACI|nr:phosphate ABC transporter permease subunit PstC [Shouchella lonarensis]SDC23886.1 phosphate ABC transporter membrane protein 1, PhoT family [Shouchella lonarensis]